MTHIDITFDHHGHGVVLVDGIDISGVVTGLRADVSASRPSRVTLELLPEHVTLKGTTGDRLQVVARRDDEGHIDAYVVAEKPQP